MNRTRESRDADPEAAGAEYAQTQLESDYFMDWVREQLTEARRMDPSQVLPLETEADARVIAKNMLQQLKWDTSRDLDPREIARLIGVDDTTQEDVKEFFKGFRDTLDMNSVWLAGELLEINQEMSGRQSVNHPARNRRAYEAQGSPIDVLRSLRSGDMVTIESPELRKPRTLVVTGTGSHEGTYAVSVNSGHVRPGHRSGGSIYTHRGDNDVYYQATLRQQTMRVSRLTRTAAAMAESVHEPARNRRPAKAYFSPVSGEEDNFGYAVKIDGIENDFPSHPFGRQGDAIRAVQQFKTTAKTDWISAKARDGRRPLTEVKRWIKSVNPSQFYARWPTNVNDDSIEIWYMDGHFSAMTSVHEPQAYVAKSSGRVEASRRFKSSRQAYRPSKNWKLHKVERIVPDAGNAKRVEFNDGLSIQVHSGHGRSDILYAMRPYDTRLEQRSPGPESRREYQYAALKAVLGDTEAKFFTDSDGDVIAIRADGGLSQVVGASRVVAARIKAGSAVTVIASDSMYRGQRGTVVDLDARRSVKLDEFNRQRVRDGAVLVEKSDGSLFVVDSKELAFYTIARSAQTSERRHPKARRPARRR